MIAPFLKVLKHPLSFLSIIYLSSISLSVLNTLLDLTLCTVSVTLTTSVVTAAAYDAMTDVGSNGHKTALTGTSVKD